MLKFYVVVRDDLSPAQQAVQGAHVVAEFAREFCDSFLDWNCGNNTLVMLRATPREMDVLLTTLNDGEFDYATFWDTVPTTAEPVRQHLRTAIAVAPNWYTQNIVLKDYKLALSDVQKSKPSKREWWGLHGAAAVGYTLMFLLVALWVVGITQ